MNGRGDRHLIYSLAGEVRIILALQKMPISIRALVEGNK
jgi:hypothetical protein